MSQATTSTAVPVPDDDDDPFAFCRANPEVLEEVEAHARETGREAFADACRNVLEQIQEGQS